MLEEKKTIDQSEEQIANNSAIADQNATVSYEQLKVLIDDHFERIKGLIRYSKEKDGNVLALSKQLQAYRDGIETTLYKRIALEVISYRESCRKSARELYLRKLTAQEAEKYIEYLKLDFDDMLQNLDVECAEERTLYNGKNIDDVIENIQFEDVPKLDEVTLPVNEVDNFAALCQYLVNCEVAFSRMIQNNVILDLAMKNYIAMAAVYERGVYQVVLYPVIRYIAKVYRDLCDRVKNIKLTDENAMGEYDAQLSRLISDLDVVLEKCGVGIDCYVSDVYDPKKHRILKMVNTDDPDLNGQIVCRYTDCYSMDDKVISLSKVDVYKVNKN